LSSFHSEINCYSFIALKLKAKGNEKQEEDYCMGFDHMPYLYFPSTRSELEQYGRKDAGG
jgi:hypothetical protein